MRSKLRAAAVITAAGAGRRFGGPKQFAFLGGRPLLRHGLDAFAACPFVERIVLVLPPRQLSRGRRMAAGPGVPVLCVPGGATRHASVRRGLAALTENQGMDASFVVLVHDGARPLVAPAQIEAAAKAAARHGAAALARPLAETVAVSKHGVRIEGYARREHLYALETPQAFRLDWWRRALSRVRGTNWTDETSFLRAAGLPVRLVLHGGWNPKITTRGDLRLAAAWLASARRKKS